MPSIFESIWDLPSSHIRVTRCDSDGIPLDATADLVLDEQDRAGSTLHDDHAMRPLMPSLKASILQEDTFKTFIALLDNYHAQEGVAEKDLDHPAHGSEVNDFLDAILPTEPMKMARDYIKSHFDTSLTDSTFREKVKSIWFEPYTNHFSGADPHCVGFEHTFVGESEWKSGQGPSKDNVGGYHSWVKYYLDERDGKANYLGHDYRPNIVDAGKNDPQIASVLLTWKPTTAEGGPGHLLFKKPGGFFVGTRPECEIALGVLGIYAIHANQFDNTPGGNSENQREVKFGLSRHFLVCHPQTLPPNGSGRQNGWHIRTMYARFQGAANGTTGPIGGGSGRSGGSGSGSSPSSPPTSGHLPTQPHNDGPIQIWRAMPNPPGPNDEGEWVEIKNVSEFTFELSQWSLADHLNRRKPLSGTILPGEVKIVQLHRSGPNSMMLRNSSGWILLFENQYRRAAVRYSSPAENEVFEFEL